jgi:hypothetical protein
MEKTMTKRILLGGLAATAVLLISGVAVSGNQQTTLDLLEDFDTQTHVLWAYPQGQQIAQDYLHDAATEHLLANLSKLHPPNPCFPLAVGWNLTVEFDEKYGVKSTFVFEFLMTLMSANQCSATITSTGGSPATMNQIGPTAP